MNESPLKTLLICHEGALLDQQGLARWLGSFSNLTGVIVLRENGERKRRRIKREIKRVGLMRFLDVLAFRVYYRLTLAERDRRWEHERLNEICSTYPETGAPVLFTDSPNSAEAEEFIKRLRPDIMLARCKTLLKESIFSLPATGTFVMHPGICPEYRNAHGCFWALANGDVEKVGMTLLRIDKGVDTGPVYGYFGYDYDELTESHIVISQRVLFDNLKAIAARLIEIYEGKAHSLDTSGRVSAAWGQPWLTAYLKWKRRRTFRVSRLASRVPNSPEARATNIVPNPQNAKRQTRNGTLRVSPFTSRVPDSPEARSTNIAPNPQNAKRQTRNAKRSLGELK